MSVKRILRAVSLCVCAAVIAVLLSGCHGAQKRAEFAVPDSFDTSKNYEITFWAKNDTNLTQTHIYEQAIKDFQKLYPNMTVKMRLYTDYSRIYNDVITNIATNTTPNVCITYPDHIATYMTGNNSVVPLDALMDDAKFGLGGSEVLFDAPTRAEIIPQFLNECTINDSTVALPFMRSTEACYVNKTLVEKLGYTVPDVLTWDFVWEVAEAATKTNADGTFAANGQKIMIPFIYKSTDNMMIQQLKQLDAGYSDNGGDVLIFNDTTKSLLETVAEHAKTKAFSTFKISSYPANFLNAGQCVFAVDSTAGATWMGAHAPLSDISADKFVEFETVVRPVPQFDAENPQMISQGPSVCVFNKEDSGEVLASWLFTQYLLTNEVQTAYSETEGYVPVTAKAQQSAEYQEYLSKSGEDNNEHYRIKIDAAKMLLNGVGETFVTPVFNGSASLRSAAGELIESTVKGVNRHKTIDDAFFEKLFDDTASLNHLDQIKAGQSEDLGPLPTASVALIAVLCAAWIIMGIYCAVDLSKKAYFKRKSTKALK